LSLFDLPPLFGSSYFPSTLITFSPSSHSFTPLSFPHPPPAPHCIFHTSSSTLVTWFCLSLFSLSILLEFCLIRSPFQVSCFSFISQSFFFLFLIFFHSISPHPFSGYLVFLLF
jgi:hypothetical protein